MLERSHARLSGKCLFLSRLPRTVRGGLHGVRPERRCGCECGHNCTRRRTAHFTRYARHSAARSRPGQGWSLAFLWCLVFHARPLWPRVARTHRNNTHPPSGKVFLQGVRWSSSTTSTLTCWLGFGTDNLSLMAFSSHLRGVKGRTSTAAYRIGQVRGTVNKSPHM